MCISQFQHLLAVLRHIIHPRSLTLVHGVLQGNTQNSKYTATLNVILTRSNPTLNNPWIRQPAATSTASMSWDYVTSYVSKAVFVIFIHIFIFKYICIPGGAQKRPNFGANLSNAEAKIKQSKRVISSW